MRGSVLAHTLSQHTRTVLLFSIGLMAVTAMYVGVFPGFQDQMEGYGEAMPEAMAAFMGDDFASPAGYVHSTIFTILGPVLFAAAAATAGAAAIAGEEEDRTLALLMTVPLSRARLAAEKLAAMLVGVTVMAVVLFAALVGMVTAVEIDLAAGNLLAGTVHLHALAVLVVAVAFAVGAATGRKALAIGAATSLVAVGFVMDGIGGMVEVAWLQRLSPFYWYSGTEPVRHGVAWGWLGLLYALAALVAAAGTRRFTRRDLT